MKVSGDFGLSRTREYGRHGGPTPLPDVIHEIDLEFHEVSYEG
jgi:hypothetical protein